MTDLPVGKAALAALVLGAVHVLLGVVPAVPLSAGMNLVLYATNLYVLYAAWATLRRRSGLAVLSFLAGWLFLFIVLLVVLDRKPLFILLVVVYASVSGSPPLLGVFALFVLSFVLLQPYALETFLPLTFIFVVLWRARRQASPFVLGCLGLGLVGLTVVLLPLFHLALGDSAQTLLRTLARPEVAAAIGWSFASSTIATLVCAAFGVPLAYALARLRFSGKGLVETLVDLPILVPQSVAGIALIVLFGPGSALGHALESLGLRVSGSLFGLVLAQVFVAAPFLIKSAMTAFEGVPLALEHASRSLGAGAAATFLHVALPLAARGVAVGAALAWARAISEFGAVLLFAGSPVTAPLLVHTEFVRAGTSESRPIATLLLLSCLWAFVALRAVPGWLRRGERRP